jgi:hypothetical protein
MALSGPRALEINVIQDVPHQAFLFLRIVFSAPSSSATSMKSFAPTFLLMAMAMVRGVAADFPPALQTLAEQFNTSWQALITSSAAQLAPARDQLIWRCSTAASDRSDCSRKERRTLPR